MNNQNYIRNFGFVILCPERNFGGLKCTIRSIVSYFPEYPYLCVVGNNASKEEMKEFSAFVPTIKAGNTYASLINKGIKENKADWSFLVLAGIPLRSSVMKKYNYFCKGEKDILFPVVDKKWLFHEATINGLFIHKKAMEEIGDFDEVENDFQKVKLLWGNKAIDNKYSFKGLIGIPR